MGVNRVIDLSVEDGKGSSLSYDFDLLNQELTQLSIKSTIESIESKDFSTETTLAAIKAKTDQLNFTGPKLRTTGEDASGGGVSLFGDTGSTTTISLSSGSTVVSAADPLRKEVIIVNTTTKTIWVRYGATAVFGLGIPLKKDAILIEDRFRGSITAIMDIGETGNIQVTNVTV